MTSTADKITFVLPLALAEPALLEWRADPTDAVLARVTLLLRSFLKFFNQHHLQDFIVVVPPHELHAVKTILTTLFSQLDARVIDETDLLRECTHPEQDSHTAVPGWYRQQILKLAIAKHVRTDFYVTLDADIACTRSFGVADLLFNGKAYTNIETPEDYAELYNTAHAGRETALKKERLTVAASVLGFDPPKALEDVFYGETPVILHTQTVRDLVAHIGARHRTSWQDYLAKRDAWTEYALYYQYLRSRGDFARHHIPVSRDTILNLSKSVWQISSSYKTTRCYDAQHFAFNEQTTGLFVAVQSWLDPSQWLPSSSFASIGDFYKFLSAHFGVGDRMSRE
jgi:hypothetical protein